MTPSAKYDCGLFARISFSWLPAAVWVYWLFFDALLIPRLTRYWPFSTGRNSHALSNLQSAYSTYFVPFSCPSKLSLLDSAPAVHRLCLQPTLFVLVSQSIQFLVGLVFAVNPMGPLRTCQLNGHCFGAMLPPGVSRFPPEVYPAFLRRAYCFFWPALDLQFLMTSTQDVVFVATASGGVLAVGFAGVRPPLGARVSMQLTSQCATGQRDYCACCNQFPVSEDNLFWFLLALPTCSGVDRLEPMFLCSSRSSDSIRSFVRQSQPLIASFLTTTSPGETNDQK